MTAGARIEVWVCAGPRTRLDATLAALEVAGARPRIAMTPRGQGLAAARNEALLRCIAPVLALVDGDVEVSPGWLEALKATWSSEDADTLACAAGPLRPAFGGSRPDWLGDALLPALGVDGEAPARTFLAGNLSVRADALRGVGGFWPARGAPGLHDRFNEEHRAQHELAEAGWRSAWVPGADAVRRIDPGDLHVRDVLRVRAHTGARTAATRATTHPATAVRAAAKATAGALVATVHRDSAMAVERAARAFEYTGELAAPLLADRSLRPTMSRTPFLQSVPPIPPTQLRVACTRSLRSVRQLRGGAPLVLLYHRIAASPEDPLALQVSPTHFAEQLDVLTTRRTPVTLEEILAGEAPPSGVAITVDDGYVDSYAALLPALEAAGVPATVFVSTGHVRTGASFWWDAVMRLLKRAQVDAGPLRLAVAGEVRCWPARVGSERHFASLRIIGWLRTMPPATVEAVLHELARWAGVDDSLIPAAEDRPMTVDELRSLAASPGVTIGSHGVGHASMAWLSAEARTEELVRSRGDLHEWLGSAPLGFAYPYGVPGVDVDAATRHAASDAGYAYGVVNAHGVLTRRTDPMGLPRAAVGDEGADAFDAWLRDLAVV